ncbi:hypothetical protein GCM10010932_09480 [Agromyces flavus]|nr:hypothetical protein GCM10010932_09480 [Agromyces flavus]
MRHPSRRLRLLAEAHAERRIGGELRLEQLDRDLASESHVGPGMDVGHAAAADEGANAVPTREHASVIVHGVSDSSRLVA